MIWVLASALAKPKFRTVLKPPGAISPSVARAVEVAAVSLGERRDRIQRAGEFGRWLLRHDGGHRAGDGDTDRSGGEAAPRDVHEQAPSALQVLESGRGESSASASGFAALLAVLGLVRLIDDSETVPVRE